MRHSLDALPRAHQGAPGHRQRRAGAADGISQRLAFKAPTSSSPRRALGFDAGPMSGLDHAKVGAAMCAGTGRRSNFLINLGYGNLAGIRSRLPRFTRLATSPKLCAKKRWS